MHVDSTDASGRSKNSLNEAIANAVGEALRDVSGQGDNQISLTVVVDGYEFDGKEYRVNVRVMVLDHTARQHELYEQLKEDKAPDLANDMTAAIYGKRAFDAEDDDLANDMQEYLDDTYLGYDDDRISHFVIMAHPMTHNHLEMEAGYFERRDPEPSPSRQYDAPEPSLGGGGSSKGSSSEDAA
jgi:hypothetical protein